MTLVFCYLGSLSAASAQQTVTVPIQEINVGADGYAHPIRFSKVDGNTFITRKVGQYLAKYDLTTSQMLGECCQTDIMFHSIGTSFDGKFAAAGPRQDATLYRVTVANYEPLSFYSHLVGHTHRVYATTFLPDNKRLISGSFHGDQTILWDFRTGQQIWNLPGQWENQVVSHDGVLYAQSNRNDIEVRRILDGSLVWRFHHQNDAGWGAGVAMAFSPDDKRLISGGTTGGWIKVWDLQTGQQLDQWQEGGEIHELFVLGDGRHLVTCNYGDQANNYANSGARLWDTTTKTVVKFFDSGRNWSCDVSPDETHLLTNTVGIVRYWRLFDQPYDSTPPSSPQAVTYSNQGSDVVISWQPASDQQSGIKFYRIYRGSSGAETYYTQVGAITSWVDTAAAGNGYSYKVTAVNGSGHESPLTSQDPMPTLTPTQSIPTPTPTPSPACRADVNGNRTVEIGDISGILFYWGASCAANMSACIADVNGNSTVEIGDIAGTLFYWGQSCP